VYTDWGTPALRRPLGDVTADEIRALLNDPAVAHFGNGSMRPKVEACLDFVTKRTDTNDARTPIAVITSLERALEAFDGEAGTLFLP
jgi:carbamate kinase